LLKNFKDKEGVILERKLITPESLRSLKYYETTKKEFYFINGGKVDYESQDELESLKPNTIVEATHSFTVKTGLDETVNTVQPGDFIKIGPLGEIYVIPEKKFDKLYEMKDGQYVPTKSPRMVTVWTGEPSEIVAPWGETMIVNPGDIIVQESKEEGKYYRVAREAFDKEYNMPEELLKTELLKEKEFDVFKFTKDDFAGLNGLDSSKLAELKVIELFDGLLCKYNFVYGNYDPYFISYINANLDSLEKIQIDRLKQNEAPEEEIKRFKKNFDIYSLILKESLGSKISRLSELLTNSESKIKFEDGFEIDNNNFFKFFNRYKSHIDTNIHMMPLMLYKSYLALDNGKIRDGELPKTEEEKKPIKELLLSKDCMFDLFLERKYSFSKVYKTYQNSLYYMNKDMPHNEGNLLINITIKFSEYINNLIKNETQVEKRKEITKSFFSDLKERFGDHLNNTTQQKIKDVIKNHIELMDLVDNSKDLYKEFVINEIKEEKTNILTNNPQKEEVNYDPSYEDIGR